MCAVASSERGSKAGGWKSIPEFGNVTTCISSDSIGQVLSEVARLALARDTRGHDPYGPGGTHTNFWHFAVGAIEKVGVDEYVLGAGYYCGHLCFARLRYTLKIAGPS